MGAVWIRGSFEGECQGGLAPPPDLTRPDARWYGLTLRHGVLRDARVVEAPPAGGTKMPFCQAKLDDCVFVSPNGIDDWHQSSVFDVRVHEWELAHHVEANNHTWAVMRGTLFARVDDGAPEPKVVLPPPVVQESDIGPLAVLLMLAWVAWLWWTCGWGACCVWVVPVALSHWRWKATPRAGASALTKGLHAVAGVGVFALGVGVFAMGVQAAQDQCELSVWLPTGFLLLCMAAASVLVPAWPLRGIWLLWSIFVSISCFRTDAVCTDVSRPKAYVKEVAAKLAPVLGLGEKPGAQGKGGAAAKGKGEGEGAGRAGGGEGEGSPGKGKGGGGKGDGRAGKDGGRAGGGEGGDGSGEGGAGDGEGSGGSGTGSGGTGSGGTGSGGTGSGGTGSGGTGSGGTGSGDGDGDGDGEGEGEGGAGTGKGKGQGQGQGQGQGKDEKGAETAERMSVDDALTDPSKFYGDKEKPKTVRLEGDLLFDFDSDQLKESAQPKLHQIAELIRQRDDRGVVLEGHSDGIGSTRHNQELSERRAHSVRQWLIHQEHINPGQLEAKGFGSKRPVVPLTGNRDAQRPNRRVELRTTEQR